MPDKIKIAECSNENVCLWTIKTPTKNNGQNTIENS